MRRPRARTAQPMVQEQAGPSLAFVPGCCEDLLLRGPPGFCNLGRFP